MGSESSLLKDLSVDAPYSTTSKPQHDPSFAVCPAKGIFDGLEQQFTVFILKKSDLSEHAHKAIDGLKTFRHPGVLKYVGVIQQSKDLLLVTERAVPLEIAIQSQEREEIYAGLLNILQAVVFLNEKGNICHGNLCVSSVFVSASGTWKLGCFENSVKVSRLSKQSCVSDLIGYTDLALSVLGFLQDETLSTKDFISRLESMYRMATEKEVVVSLKMLLTDDVFCHPFLHIMCFMQSLPLKSDKEKDGFFVLLKEKLEGIPQSALCRQLLPLMFSEILLTDESAEKFFLCHLFASGSDYCVSNSVQPILSQDLFVKYSLPLILPLFDSRNMNLRMILIKFLPLFIDIVDKDVITKKLLPQILLGLHDSRDCLVVATFHALAYLVPVLGSSVVVGGSREVLFYDRKPDFSRASISEKIAPQNCQDAIPNIAGLRRDISTTILSEASTTKCYVEEHHLSREERRKIRTERRRDREEKKANKNLTQTSLAEPDRNSVQRCSAVLDERKFGNPVRAQSVDFSDQAWEGFEATSSESEDAQVSFRDAFVRNTEVILDARALPKCTCRGSIEGESCNAENHDDHQRILNSTSEKRSSRETRPSDSSAVNQLPFVEKLEKQLPSMRGLPRIERGSLKLPAAVREDSLGSEFDIKVKATNNGKYSEPDYFADILAEVDVPKPTTVIGGNPPLERKFCVTHDGDNQVEDHGNGWENDDW